VTYRFVIAATAMAAIALVKGDGLRLPRSGVAAAAILGLTQFCINFNAVYLAERHITSGVVATVFALLLIPSSLLAWAFLGHKPTERFFWSSTVAVAGIALLFIHEFNENPANASQVVAGIGLTLAGMVGASSANVLQARPEVRRFPLFTMLAWSMALGALIDGAIALAMTGPPVIEARPIYWAGLIYLALAASVLTVQSLLSGRAHHRSGQGRLLQRSRAHHRHGLFDRIRGLSLDPDDRRGGPSRARRNGRSAQPGASGCDFARRRLRPPAYGRRTHHPRH
jgi:drug/metabolite transporter (DMT)-like permease